ncbi:hypothetical protein [uncultured Sphingomonas sp.]|uniref:hypothetical protein n=1 Tax=uncultured Sphingomonas sp. TaxID=158754 RepID=UPI0035CC6D85
MDGGSTVLDLRAEAGRVPVAEMANGRWSPVPAEASSLPAEDERPANPVWRRLAAAAAIVATLGWIGGIAWFTQDTLSVLPPVELAELAGAAAIVPTLIGVLWLLALRTSRAEARRFGATAAAMRAEAASLEQAVARMGATMAAERAALAAQVADLLARGDAAADRLGAVARGVAGEVERADAHAASLAEAAAGAQASVGVLLASLPRARSDVEAAAQLIDRAGMSAAEHAAGLDAQLRALAERGRAADEIAGGAAQKLSAHLTRMAGTGEAAAQRLEGVTAEMATAVDALLDRTAAAVDQSRQGIAAQGDAMLAMVGAHQAALDTAARGSADALAERIAAVETAIGRVAERLEAQRTAGDMLVGGLAGGLERVDGQLAALHRQGVEKSQLLAASISALGGSADAMTESLRAGEALATRTIGTTESLLIALDSAAREIDETLPDALARLDQRIGQSKAVVVAAKPELLALVTAAESTHDAIEAVAGVIAEQRRVVDQLAGTLLQTLTDGRAKADALGTMVTDTVGQANRFAEEAAPRLLDALLRVRDTAQAAADKARETLATVIPEAAARLEEASAAALRRAAGDTVERQIAAVTDATAAAVDASTRATERLAQQVQLIADQSAILETRMEDVRAEREEGDRDTLARRTSLLIEALNSAAIDITRILAPEVADSAWGAYLKGDRGVFTRRAVRLLDAGEAREIARLYDDDAGFREQVNRYIHDFESMLRGVLAQRDGSPLGVTLLSSDMGKLYVALAQAIERLR